VISTGHKVVIVFDGRDAAGKGGAIKRISCCFTFDEKAEQALR